MRAAGYVLVGGKSSRLGRDKALVPVEGRPLALRVAAVVRKAAGSVTLVGSPERYESLGLRAIPDAAEDIGPLGGLVAALEDSLAPWSLIAACDMPHISKAFLKFLLAQTARGSADIVMPVDSDGRDEPLCAVYAATARETIHKAVRSGIRKVTRTFEDLRVTRIEYSAYAHLDPKRDLFANLNTEEDFSIRGLRVE